MINTPKPPQLAGILSKLKALQATRQQLRQEIGLLVGQVDQVVEHLELVAKAVFRNDKSVTPEPPRYAFGPANAEKAQRALSHTPRLRNALEQGEGEIEAALAAAHEIDQLFPE